MKFVMLMILGNWAAIGFSQELTSYFDCSDSPHIRPYYLQAINEGTEYKDWSQTPKGLLGQNAMDTMAECEQAADAANKVHGVVCSRTGLDGWKPTLYTGTRPGRADFGYLGGSSIMRFSDCLQATAASSSKGVCFWGGSDWYVSPIDRAGVIAGPFAELDNCIAYTKLDEI